MSRLPDAGTLDALVLGTDATENAAAWEALLRHPEAVEAWQRAAARRRRMDLVATAIRARPWLAQVVQQMSSLSRRLRTTPGFTIAIRFPDAELDELAMATLGPVDAQDEREAARPSWGTIVPVRLQVGKRITLQPSSATGLIDVRYLCNRQEGSLPTRTWQLEPAEAPVLLIAAVGASHEAPLSKVLEGAEALAGVLVVEDVGEGRR
jgi:hypothetical protein